MKYTKNEVKNISTYVFNLIPIEVPRLDREHSAQFWAQFWNHNFVEPNNQPKNGAVSFRYSLSVNLYPREGFPKNEDTFSPISGQKFYQYHGFGIPKNIEKGTLLLCLLHS